MRSVVIPLILAIVLGAAGGVFWMVGQADRRVADVHHQLATLQCTRPPPMPALTSRVPRSRAAAAGRRPAGHRRRARRDDDGPLLGVGLRQAMQPQHDANGTVTDTDPAMLLLAANAAFRASQASPDRAETVRRLDGAIKSYVEALKVNGQDVNTAFNYASTLVRMRDALGKARAVGAEGRRRVKQAALEAI